MKNKAKASSTSARAKTAAMPAPAPEGKARMSAGRAMAIFGAAVSVALCISAFAFFAFMYPAHLHYHEDLQLFQYTGTYASQVLALPGGVAAYLSRFVVQFYYHSALGAAILALLLVACQRLTWRLMCRRTLTAYGLSLMPALLAWAFLCHEEALPSALIALIIGQLAAFFAAKAANRHVMAALWLAGTPVLYFMVGPLGFVYTLALGVIVWRAAGMSVKYKTSVTFGVLAIALLCPVIAHCVYPYPMAALIKGVGYMRQPASAPVAAWIAAVIVPGVQLLSLAFSAPAGKARQPWRFAVFVALLVILAGAYVINDNADFGKEEVYRYHYLAGEQRWDDILLMADRHAPDGPVQMIYTNLALAKTGQLNKRLTDYPQKGTAGLMAQFGDHYFPPFATAEAFWHAGMVKPAMHYFYEIQQSVPDAQMSARCMRRMAELYIANGDTQLARKYLKALSHSLYYRDWAKEQLKKYASQSHDPSADADLGPQVGSIQSPDSADLFFNPGDMGGMLRSVVVSHPDNSVAFDYLVAWYLLNRDIEPLPEIMQLPGAPNGVDIPVSLQQALVLQWAHDHTSWDGLPWAISDEVKHDFIDFSNVYTPGMNVASLPDKLLNTYWAYYFND